MSKTYSNDVAQFNAHADQWWDADGPYKTLHQINPLRLNFITQHVTLKGQNILDVGCGGGILSEGLAHRGAVVTGIDPAADLIRIAKSHAQKHNQTIHYEALEAQQLVQQKHTFDVVCCMEVLEHVPNPNKLVHTLSALCKPNGWVFLSTVNRNMMAWFGMIVLAEKCLKWLPEGTHNASQFIRPDELTLWATASELTLKETKGLIFDPLNGQFRLSTNTAINYLQAFQKKA